MKSRPLSVVSGLAVGLLLLAACEPVEDFPGYEGLGPREPAVTNPVVERDLDAIRQSGAIRMLTRYNSTNYFIHKGGGAGFDYELFARFAREHGLAVEVVIPEPGEDLLSLLNSGAGDVVCAGMTRTPQLAQYAAATRPVNFVHKVLVMREGAAARPDGLAALSGLTVTLPAHDTFRSELLRLREAEGLDFILQTAHPLVEAEELIAQVARGEIQATVADDAIVQATQAYLPPVRTGPVLGERRPVVWLVRENSPDLRAALNAFLKVHFWVLPGGAERRSQDYGIIYDRYFRNIKTIQDFQTEADRPDKGGRISRYDGLIREESERHGLDWRLVAALIYQESRFYPRAVSSAGAVGLMQVIPRFAGDQADSLFVPGANVRAGLRLLQETFDGFAYLDSLERIRFTLAVYHAGYGHVTDARRIAMDLGRDPNVWSSSLDDALPRLMQRRWYDETRHGYYRGGETVRYVEEIMNRYAMYSRLVPREPGSAVVAPDTLLAPADTAIVPAPSDTLSSR